MSIELHESDKHAPFRHKYITTPKRTIKLRGRKEKVIRGGLHFIVCGFCRHWINRPLAEKCKCPASCHAEANGEYIPHPAR